MRLTGIAGGMTLTASSSRPSLKAYTFPCRHCALSSGNEWCEASHPQMFFFQFVTHPFNCISALFVNNIYVIDLLL